MDAELEARSLEGACARGTNNDYFVLTVLTAFPLAEAAAGGNH
jgi:hypothetical protein